MYNPTHALIQSFIQSLKETYQDIFGHHQSDYVEVLGTTAQQVLQALARSDALYHDLEHTILVVVVGQEILRAKQIVDGSTTVLAEDWLHMVIALLCHDVGYLKGICQADDRQHHRYVTGKGQFITLTPDATDAALTFCHVDRGLQFVAEQFAQEPLIDVTRIQHMIELTRFPVPQDALHQDTCGYGGLARAGDLIGQLGDRHYLQKLPGLFHEFEETGANAKLGYRSPADVRDGFPGFYWNVVHPYIQDAIAYLSHTQSGQKIIIDLYANVLTVEAAQQPTRHQPQTVKRAKVMPFSVLAHARHTVKLRDQAC